MSGLEVWLLTVRARIDVQLLGHGLQRRQLWFRCVACRVGERAIVGRSLWCWHRHEQVDLRAAGRRAFVDRGIAAVVAALWDAGVRTLNSCEGDAGGDYPYDQAYVQVDADDAGHAAIVLNEHSVDATPDVLLDIAGGTIAFRWTPTITTLS